MKIHVLPWLSPSASLFVFFLASSLQHPPSSPPSCFTCFMISVPLFSLPTEASQVLLLSDGLACVLVSPVRTESISNYLPKHPILSGQTVYFLENLLLILSPNLPFCSSDQCVLVLTHGTQPKSGAGLDGRLCLPG